jgi:hypothetical protein
LKAAIGDERIKRRAAALHSVVGNFIWSESRTGETERVHKKVGNNHEMAKKSGK